MQAALRKPRPDLVWTDFWPLINKVIHKKREQLGQLRFAAWVSSSTTCLLRIAQINRIIKVEMRVLLCRRRTAPFFDSEDSARSARHCYSSTVRSPTAHIVDSNESVGPSGAGYERPLTAHQFGWQSSRHGRAGAKRCISNHQWDGRQKAGRSPSNFRMPDIEHLGSPSAEERPVKRRVGRHRVDFAMGGRFLR